LRRPAPACLVTACLVAAGGLALAGCGGIDAALSRQWATVNFEPGTTTGTITAVARTCGGGPGLRPAPVSAVPGTAAAPSSLRYDVSGARPADLARLQRCLMAHFSGQVIGVSLKDVASQG
jgi:hypothetical protein